MFWGNLSGENTPVGKAIAYLSNEFDDVGQFVEGVKNKQARLAGTSSNQQQDQTLAAQLESQAEQQLEKQAVTEIDAAMSDVDTANAVVTSENEQSVEKQTAASDQQLSQDNASIEKNR